MRLLSCSGRLSVTRKTRGVGKLRRMALLVEGGDGGDGGAIIKGGGCGGCGDGA